MCKQIRKYQRVERVEVGPYGRTEEAVVARAWVAKRARGGYTVIVDTEVLTDYFHARDEREARNILGQFGFFGAV